jgi:hypothetical protein
LLVAAKAAPPRRSKEVMAAAETEPPRAFSAQSGVDGEALKVRRWRICHTVERTGQAWESPERPWPTVSPRTAFFWLVKIRTTKVAWRS